MEGLIEKVALKMTWKLCGRRALQARGIGNAKTQACLMCPDGQCWSRENKGVKGRGELRQVIRSWVMWGLEGQGEEAWFYWEMGKLYVLFLSNLTRKQKNLFWWCLCFTKGYLWGPRNHCSDTALGPKNNGESVPCEVKPKCGSHQRGSPKSLNYLEFFW